MSILYIWVVFLVIADMTDSKGKIITLYITPDTIQTTIPIPVQ